MSNAAIYTAVKNRLSERMCALDRGVVDPLVVQSIAEEVYAEFAARGLEFTETERYILANRAALEVLRMDVLMAPMLDPEVTEIMVNGPYTIFLEKAGKRYEYEKTFADEQALRGLVSRLVDLVPGKRVDESSPMVDLSLPDGSRVNIAIPPVVAGGPQITIRKYMRSLAHLEDIQAMGSLDQRMTDFLRACVRGHLNLLFSGASGSGKTTLMETLAHEISSAERLVVIEDTFELRLSQPNVVRMITRTPNFEGYGEITTGQCFHNSLRMRPSRIILGELRGPEALDYLQALNSGHRGSLAVIHASSPLQAVTRVENLALMGHGQVPASVITQQLVQGLDVVIQMDQLSDGSRKITRISQLSAVRTDGSFVLEDLFRFRQIRRRDDGVIEGKFVATGVLPYFLHHLQLEGVPVRATTFTADLPDSTL